MRKNITAVMIAKDEQEHLERCLTSVKSITDKIVVVDTGSTDATMEIAHSFGAEVYQHLWADSFSAARNHALEYVMTKWALQMDADEEVIQSTIHHLDNLEDSISAYLTPIQNNNADGSMSLHYFERLYQPEKVRYIWRAHNELVVEGDTEKTEFTILHHGYALSPDEMRKKSERTLRLLMMDIDDAGYVKRNVVYLVQTLRSLQKWERLIETVRQYGHVVDNDETAYQMIHVALMLAYEAISDPALAIRAGEEILADYPCNIDALFSLAVIYQGQGLWEKAVGGYLSYIRRRRRLQYGGTVETMIYSTWGSLLTAFASLGTCLVSLDRTNEAALAFSRADRLAIGRSDEENDMANTDQVIVRLIEQESLVCLEPAGLTDGGWSNDLIRKR